MNFSSDIIKYAIPHHCGQCVHRENCNQTFDNAHNPCCRDCLPDNMDNFLNDTINYFSLNVPKSKEPKLKRVCTHQRAYNDKVATLDYYYVNFINDCISELRKGKTVYIFKLSHLWEIMRFCSDISATYVGDGIIGLTGNCKCKRKMQN